MLPEFVRTLSIPGSSGPLGDFVSISLTFSQLIISYCSKVFCCDHLYHNVLEILPEVLLNFISTEMKSKAEPNVAFIHYCCCLWKDLWSQEMEQSGSQITNQVTYLKCVFIIKNFEEVGNWWLKNVILVSLSVTHQRICWVISTTL